jgi:tetratricopeptide (TPR) repeat protein
MPGHRIDPKSIPDMGLMSIVTEVDRGNIKTSTSMYLEDLRLMLSYLRWVGKGGAGMAAAPPPTPRKKKKRTEKKLPRPVVKDAGYWVDQGALAATYGAYDTAIKYYKKALAMGAEKSRLYFSIGVAYGELGDYPKAHAYLEKAIQLKPGAGDYYYARGRIYLLSGDKDSAMLDFEHAAEAGSVDAQRYLEGEGQ